VYIATERSLVANLAQELTHTGMVLQIPRRQVRWQPLDLECPGRGARRKRPLEHRPEHGGIALDPDPYPVVEIPFGPSTSGGMRTRPRIPNVRASATARSVASRSSATYTRSARRNNGNHATCQPPVP
jgi:hypothetical protein